MHGERAFTTDRKRMDLSREYDLVGLEDEQEQLTIVDPKGFACSMIFSLNCNV